MIPGALAALFFERYRRNAHEREKVRPEAASKKADGSSATQRDAKDGPLDGCNRVVQAKEGAVNAARVAESDERARRGAGGKSVSGEEASAATAPPLSEIQNRIDELERRLSEVLSGQEGRAASRGSRIGLERPIAGTSLPPSSPSSDPAPAPTASQSPPRPQP